MISNKINPRKSLNKAFLKVKPNRSEIEVFKANLIQLIDQTNDTESEEFHKNLVSGFLRKTYYDPNHSINTKGRNDLVIHNGKDAKSSVGVIIEAKKPTNKTEMLSAGKLNAKAFQELVLYYLRERIAQKNLEIKYLIATNIHEWFVFDANVFEKNFAQNKKLVKQFEDFESGRLAGKTTDFFYKEIAEPFIEQLDHTIDFTHFDLREYEKPLRNVDKRDDNKLIALFKLLSPEHLLKLPFANDSNSLDKRFYSELLHIIGLTETKDGGKKIIRRNKAGERNTGSLLENAIIQLDTLDKIHRLEKPSQYGDTLEDRLFNVGLELSITWVNRILFLKLLEAQLIAYHKNDESYSFLNFKLIGNYDDLNSLFFQVLAKQYHERNEDVRAIFDKVPYLNSSLFEPSELEHATIFISNLRDEKKLPILPNTVLKDKNGKKMTGEINALEYFFAFLEAYDFSSEGAEDIQEDNKTLINASVLGLIFEKINGYKDGSFFTPGFITMYMCRETIRRSVVQKFNDAATPLLRGGGGVPHSNYEGVSNSKHESATKRRAIIPYNPKLKELARKLRNESTKSEVVLWKALKGKFAGKYDFHRQKPLDNYIADFFCHELKLVIEIDGITHDEWEETQRKDFEKESKLNELGLNVLRYSDEEVLNHINAILSNLNDYIAGFEKGDLSSFKYEDTPLNPYSNADFVVSENDTPLNPLSRGDFAPRFKTLDDVYQAIGEDDDDLFSRQEANNIINSLKICDPAVGSGHFLVSALNEMIAVKSDLKILQDRDGRRLKEYVLEVVNDELVITDDDGELFEYTINNKESQRLQETLFHEKQTIIENCLFGVDINPNSVKICRLRLWIELLKNAYYKTDTSAPGNASPTCYADSPELRSEYRDEPQLETLPNIDINIKCGNSLISRFALDADIHEALKKSKWTIDSYRMAVDGYRNAQSKEEKHEMERLIKDIKSDFRSEISKNDKKIKSLYKLQGELANLTTQTSMFEMSDKEKKDWNKKVEKLAAAIKNLEAEIEEIKNNKIYENAFEWRFEFPEVLNDEGDFVGFDTVIGNPPYFSLSKIKEHQKFFEKAEYKTYSKGADIYCLFYERGGQILRIKGILTYITSNSWLRAIYGNQLKSYFLTNTPPISLLNIEDIQIFDEATVESNIITTQKGISASKFPVVNLSLNYNLGDDLQSYFEKHSFIFEIPKSSEWFIGQQQVSTLKLKIESNSKLLKEFDIQINFGIKTGFNEAFIIDEDKRNELNYLDPKNNNIIKPILRGRDLNKYLYSFENLFLINTHNGLKRENLEPINSKEDYPFIYEHLVSFSPKVEKRYDQGIHWSNLRNCAYLNDFEKPKIVWGEISDRPKFAYDESGFYNEATTFLMTGEKLKFLLGILNSRVSEWYFNLIGTTTGMGTNRWKKYKIELLPIKEPTEKQETEIESKVNQILDLKKADPEADTTALEAEIDQLVYQLYGLTEEEIAVVEESVK